MRKLMMAMLVLCAAGQAFALNPLGPPRAGLKQRQNSMAFLFASSEMDFEVSGAGFSWTATDIDWKNYLARIGYGLSDSCEFYSLLGFSKCSTDDFTGSSEFAWGLGLKLTVAESDQIKWGGMFQVVDLNSEQSVTSEEPYNGYTSANIDVQLYDIQIAFGPTYTKEGFSIYGGPFLHFIEGELDVRANGDSASVDIEQKSEFGGYVGAMIELAESASLFCEYQKTGDASAIAGGIVWRF